MSFRVERGNVLGGKSQVGGWEGSKPKVSKLLLQNDDDQRQEEPYCPQIPCTFLWSPISSKDKLLSQCHVGASSCHRGRGRRSRCARSSMSSLRPPVFTQRLPSSRTTRPDARLTLTATVAYPQETNARCNGSAVGSVRSREPAFGLPAARRLQRAGHLRCSGLPHQ